MAKLSTALCLASALLSTHDVIAFTTLKSPTSMQTPLRRRMGSRAGVVMMSSFFVDATESTEVPQVKEQVDSNGKVFSPGCTVAIASNRSVKAYHVPKSSFGTFDPSSLEFIPQDESNVSRGTSCLVLPGGLRGEVEKIYNTNEWDRAHPILVKFTAGEDREGGGGYNIPKAFTMHFDADEIEVLD